MRKKKKLRNRYKNGGHNRCKKCKEDNMKKIKKVMPVKKKVVPKPRMKYITFKRADGTIVKFKVKRKNG